MSSDVTAIDQIKETDASEAQVVAYLRAHPEFFVGQDDLITELSLPHESGKAISLLERQVTVLRERGLEARQKLGNLLENARSNDQFFDTTRSLVLALLRANNTTELANATQDQLTNHANIDACEIILVEQNNLNVSESIRTYPPDTLKQDFKDVFRLQRTYCGALEKWQVEFLFPGCSESLKSTAICPITHDGQVLALLAFGNKNEDYFNVQLDTLFLDFIGHVVGAVLSKQLIKG
ncbi:MAG: hypothetical protein ACJATW_001565 [Glaciecola sp.]|jgi:uncharacterized protein YigA (DUF484 family)